jgi:hypothetical protein
MTSAFHPSGRLKVKSTEGRERHCNDRKKADAWRSINDDDKETEKIMSWNIRKLSKSSR